MSHRDSGTVSYSREVDKESLGLPHTFSKSPLAKTDPYLSGPPLIETTGENNRSDT